MVGGPSWRFGWHAWLSDPSPDSVCRTGLRWSPEYHTPVLAGVTLFYCTYVPVHFIMYSQLLASEHAHLDPRPGQAHDCQTASLALNTSGCALTATRNYQPGRHSLGTAGRPFSWPLAEAMMSIVARPGEASYSMYESCSARLGGRPASKLFLKVLETTRSAAPSRKP